MSYPSTIYYDKGIRDCPTGMPSIIERIHVKSGDRAGGEYARWQRSRFWSDKPQAFQLYREHQRCLSAFVPMTNESHRDWNYGL